MSLFDAIGIAATSLEAQSIRLNTISSNLANSNVISSSEDATYRGQYPVFEVLYDESRRGYSDTSTGVRVSDVVTSQLPPRKEFSPSHPLSDDEGYIYRPAVNSVEEMVDMVEASRSYQDSIEAMNTTKQLILRTLTLGR